MRAVHDDLAAVDLNLLRSLDALLAERHVTRAAARLGVSQSAASHALARLRELLGDPLLVRGPRGTLLTTARADELAPTVHRALGELATAWRGAAFDAATAPRTFHVGAGDYVELVMLPGLAARIGARAPRVDLFLHAVPDDIPTALARGELDLILAPARPRDVSASCYQRLLFDERLVCAMRAGHPAAASRLTLDRFCALDHLLVAPRGTAGSFVEDALDALGRRRRVALTVPHFLIVPHLLAATDLVCTIAARIAAAFATTHDLVTRPPPITIAPFPMHMIWHERTNADAAHRWLRDQIVATTATVLGKRAR